MIFLGWNYPRYLKKFGNQTKLHLSRTEKAAGPIILFNQVHQFVIWFNILLENNNRLTLNFAQIRRRKHQNCQHQKKWKRLVAFKKHRELNLTPPLKKVLLIYHCNINILYIGILTFCNLSDFCYNYSVTKQGHSQQVDQLQRKSAHKHGGESQNNVKQGIE